MKPTIFYLVRHGETLWNAEHKIQGHTDNPLTDKGEQQAKELADNLKAFQFDLIYSSDLIRARKTAEIIAANATPITTSPILRERNMGTLEGKIFRQDITYEEYAEWFGKHDDKARSQIGIESDQEVMERLLKFFKDVHKLHPGKTILVASHASLMKALLVFLGFATHKELGNKTVKNTGYIKLAFDGEKLSLLATLGITKRSSEEIII